MIGRFKDILVEKNPPQAIIDVNGAGYEVDVSMQTFYRLPTTDEAVQLYIQFVVCGNMHLLFDFAMADERTTFRQLVKVNGIGAKTAPGILSAVGTDELAQVIAEEDVKRLSSAPGVDKKTAEHMVLELCGKLVSVVSDDPVALPATADEADNIVSTPLAPGYNEREAKAAVRGLPRGTDVGEGVRLVLENPLK